MGLLSRDIRSLGDLVVQALGEQLYAEKRCARMLPTLVAKVSDTELKAELTAAQTASAAAIRRLEDVFRLMDRAARPMECPAIDGFFISVEENSGEIDDPHVLDAAIAAAVQDVAAYRAGRCAKLTAWLRQLGRPDAARLIQPNQLACQRFAETLGVLAERRLDPRAGGRPAPIERLAG